MTSLPGQVVVVGGTKGLGRLIADRFLNQGVKVTVLSRHKPDECSVSSHFCHVAVDLGTLHEVEAVEVAHMLFKQAGPVRYLIFCQRYRGQGDAWSGEIQLTLTATDCLIRALAPFFCEEGDKAIAVVSSVYANHVGSSQPASYHVAKAGLNQLVKYYAWQYGPHKIRINAIMPLTYIKEESRAYYQSQSKLMALYKNFVPLQRMGEADDSANLVEFLCSEQASFITGQSISVDGGTSIVWPEEIARSLMGV